MTPSPQPESPEPLKVVAWTYTHKISEAGCVSTWRWPIGHPALELHDEEELVRLSDAEAAIQAARNEAEARVTAWKDYAQHQEHCPTCAEAVQDCYEGSRLRDAAMKGDAQ